MPPHLVRRPGEVHLRGLASELGGEGGQRVVLRLGARDPQLDQRQRLDQRGGSELAQAERELARGLVVEDRGACDVHDRPRVQSRDHLHDRHAGLGAPLGDRRLNRSGAAQRGKQRGVNVQRAEARQIDQRARQDVAVGDHDADVGRQRLHLLEERLVATWLLRLEDRQSLFLGDDFHRRRLERGARASHRLVRLRDDPHDVEPLAEQGAQRRGRKVRSAPVQHPHQSSSSGCSCSSRSSGVSSETRRMYPGYLSASNFHFVSAAVRLRTLR